MADTIVPAQTAPMAGVGVNVPEVGAGLKVMLIGLEVAGFPDVQGVALDVSTQVI